MTKHFSPQPFQVLLDSDAYIVGYKDPENLLGYGVEGKPVIGKNWFSNFIDSADLVEIMSVFLALFDEGREKEFKSFNNDVLTEVQKHQMIDFSNHIREHNRARYLECFGFPHQKNSLIATFNEQAYESLIDTL